MFYEINSFLESQHPPEFSLILNTMVLQLSVDQRCDKALHHLFRIVFSLSPPFCFVYVRSGNTIKFIFGPNIPHHDFGKTFINTTDHMGQTVHKTFDILGIVYAAKHIFPDVIGILNFPHIVGSFRHYFLYQKFEPISHLFPSETILLCFFKDTE